MEMTHYMELLASNQPWNLIFYMAIPVILGEIVAITELFILFRKRKDGVLGILNKIAGISAGIYFSIIFFVLLNNAVIPLTINGQWRGLFDIVAVGFYMAGIVPLLGITLLELGLIFKKNSFEEKIFRHSILVAIFLVVAHIAMIFGMLNPSLIQSKTKVEIKIQSTEHNSTMHMNM